MSTGTALPADAPPRAPGGRGRIRAAIGVFGELLITAGLLVGLYVLYLLFGTGIDTGRAQNDLESQLQQEWSSPISTDAEDGEPEPAALKIGDAFGILRIPRLGASWEWIVQEGVTLDVLADGPGRYPSSDNPGKKGVVSIAGHRATHGEPFANLDAVRPGDTIELEVRQGIYTYTVRDTALVLPSDTWVLEPRAGIQKGLTLTTCHPRWGSSQRLIVWAEQTDVAERTSDDSTEGN